MKTYKCLDNSKVEKGDFSIVPIRFEDRLMIMKWRNEQIYHLRQTSPLTETGQTTYFETIIADLFNKENPDQVLFSYLKGGVCIGYGGLVHINWADKNAEISFIMNTQLETEEFEFHWLNFLGMIEEIGFERLALKKIYVYAFDLRPHLYKALLKGGFFEDARLKDHCLFNGAFKDVVIHSKINSRL